MKNGKLTVAIVGMGFGSCFLPIYLKHPDVEHVIMVDTNPDQLKVAGRYVPAGRKLLHHRL